MRKQYIAALSIASAIGLGLAGANVVSAHGLNGAGMIGAGFHMPMHQFAADPTAYAERLKQQFAHDAQLLGITEAEVKTAWADGKDLFQLAKEKGISETDLQAKLKTMRDNQLKIQFDTLVSQGIITREQADKRIAAMSKLVDKASGMHGRMRRAAIK